MPSSFNWLAHWQRSVGTTIYNTINFLPLVPYTGFQTNSFARQFQNSANVFSLGGRQAWLARGVAHVRVNAIVGGQRPVVAVHPSALPISIGDFTAWPSSLRPDPGIAESAWVGTASDEDQSTRVASLFIDINSIGTITTFAGRYAIGQFIATNPKDRAGAVLCGAVSGTTINPPWIYASISELRSPYDNYGSTRYDAIFARDATVLPWSALVELDYRADADNRNRLASIIVLGHQSISLGKGHAAIVCDDVGANCAASFCMSFPLPSLSLSTIVLTQYQHPILISSGISPDQMSGNHAASVMNSSTVPQPLASCSGIKNTTYPALRRRGSGFDWGAVTRMPFLSATSVSFTEKNRLFQSPSIAMPFLASVNGLGSAVSSLHPQEQYSLRPAVPFPLVDVADSPLLASDNISYVAHQCHLDANIKRLLSPAATEMPVLLESEQSTFKCAGKTVSGCTVRFTPWTSPGSSPVVSFGRNFSGISNPITEFTNQQTAVISRSPNLPPPDESGVWWRVGLNQRLFVVDQTNAGVVDNTGVRLYDTRRYDPWSRSGSFTATYQRDASYDEQGYLAGEVATLLTSNGHFATASEQSSPINLAGNNSPAAITNKYPTTSAAASGTGRYYPSLAGSDFACTASSEGGVPFSAGTFRYRGEGGSFSVSLQQQAQGVETWTVYDKPVPGLPPIQQGFNETSVTVSFQAGQRPYSVSATHNMTFQTTFVDLFVQWFAAIQGPGGRSTTPELRAGINPYDARGAISTFHIVDDSVESQVRPALAARVFVRATGKVIVDSQWTFPNVLEMSGAYPLRANAQGQIVDSSLVTFYGKNTSIRLDESLAAWEDVKLEEAKTIYFDADQTELLLAGQEVTPTQWYKYSTGDSREALPELFDWHSLFGYKMAFSLDVD